MDRREFCRKLAMVGGAVVLGPVLKACAPAGESPTATPHPTANPSATPFPTAIPPTGTATAAPTQTPPPDPTATPHPTAQPPTAEGDVAHVALVKTTDRAAGVQRALDLLVFGGIRGSRVLLKPNLNSADAAPASTHPDVMRALLLALNDRGAHHVTVGERSGMGDTRRVMEQTGLFTLADEFGVDTVAFDELAQRDWVVRRDDDFHWADGFAVPRLLLDTECVVQTCNLKTHRYGGHFTMSLKNSVGFAAKTAGGSYNYMQELHRSPHQRHMIAEINTVYSPALIVLDGIEAFVDGGPARGTKVSPNVVLAGTDRVAVDAVGVAILRLFGTTPEVSAGPIFAQEQIARAVELGLGVDAPAKIRLLTDDAAGAAYADRIQSVLLS